MSKPHLWPRWPAFDKEHEDAVLRVIRSNQLFADKEVAEFEEEFKTSVGSKHAVGIGNATQGLQLTLAALGVGTGDEVIVTPYSWISSASCVLMQNAVPVFVDIEVESFGICPKALSAAITPKTKAVVLVHMFGLCSKINEIKLICEESGIYLIEDASHVHGAEYFGRSLGTFGIAGVFSLHQRKAIPAGDGGVICTNEKEIYEKVKRLRSFGDHQLSYNYRMTEFAACIARVGLRRLEQENELRRMNHQLLEKSLDGSGIKVVESREGVKPVFYSNLLIIDAKRERQEELLEYASTHGVPIKRTWQMLNKHPHFKKKNMINQIAPWDYLGSDRIIEPSEVRMKNAERYQERLLFELDCHPLVTQEAVEYAGKLIKDYCSRWK